MKRGKLPEAMVLLALPQWSVPNAADAPVSGKLQAGRKEMIIRQYVQKCVACLKADIGIQLPAAHTSRDCYSPPNCPPALPHQSCKHMPPPCLPELPAGARGA